MVEVYKSVSQCEKGMLYCSSPLSTGKRYKEWLKRNNKKVLSLDSLLDSPNERDHASYNTEVVGRNIRCARQLVNKLRKEKSDLIVIDPTAMPSFPEWKQQDWRCFWGTIIKEYATETPTLKLALFANDWQYSSGCAYEFLVAQFCRTLNKTIRIVDAEGNKLSAPNGRNMIRDAIVEAQKEDWERDEKDTALLEELVDELNKL